MNKNTLKRVFSAISLSAVAVSATTMIASAEDNPYDKQDNKEVAFIDDYTSNPPELAKGADGTLKFTSDEIAASTYKPQISISKIELTLDEAKANPVQTVNFDLAPGVEDRIMTVGLHPIWDTRLTLTKSGRTYAKRGEALDIFQLAEDPTNVPNGYMTVTAMASTLEDVEGLNTSGTMFSLNFTIPDDVKAGDLYPIGIRYQNPGNTNDQFTSKHYDTQEAMLMEAYTFTRGITSGYIKIEGATTTTTTTTTTTSSTTTTTTSSTTTSSTTTTTGTPVVTTTTVSSSRKIDPKPKTTTTKAKTTAKPKTTTKKNDPPKTGVAGVGIATAGLAVAIGTAFVLRKKED